MLDLIRVLAPNPSVYTLEGTNSWVVGRDPAVVIDPGPDDPGHLAELGTVATERGGVGAVLVTHDHPDHAPGAPGFARTHAAPLYAFRLAGAEHLRDGQRIRVGSSGRGRPLELTALHTPGHTADHVAFHVASSSAMFTGDAVLGRGTSFIDPPDGDLRSYLRSLQRMADLEPATLYPGHGPVVLHAGDTLRRYLAHRQEREAQVLETMDGGADRIEEIVEVIYASYPPEVHALAGRSVLAHLLKLEADGRVERTGHGEDARWSLRQPRACARCGKPVNGRAHYCGACSLVMLQEGEEPARDV